MKSLGFAILLKKVLDKLPKVWYNTPVKTKKARKTKKKATKTPIQQPRSVIWAYLVLLLGIAVYEVYPYVVETRTPIYLLDSEVASGEYPKEIFCNGGSEEMPTWNLSKTHGEDMLDVMIKQKPDWKKVCVEPIVVFDHLHKPRSKFMPEKFMRSMIKLTSAKPGYINLSLSGAVGEYAMGRIYQSLIDQGHKVSAAAGNDNRNLNRACTAFPACFKLTVPDIVVSTGYWLMANRWTKAIKHSDVKSSSEATAKTTALLAQGFSEDEIKILFTEY